MSRYSRRTTQPNRSGKIPTQSQPPPNTRKKGSTWKCKRTKVVRILETVDVNGDFKFLGVLGTFLAEGFTFVAGPKKVKRF